MSALPYSQDLSTCTGSQGSLVTPEAMQQAQAKLPAALERLAQQAKELPILQLPAKQDDLAEIEDAASHLQQFKRVVVFGTGGSSLGGQMLCELTQHAFAPETTTQVQFIDNVDPHTLHSLVDNLQVEDTAFLSISKSGGTVETLSQTLLVLDRIQADLGKDALAKHCLCITEPGKRPLRELGEQYGLRVLEHDPGVGGRFSVLSNVGLIPAATAGVDIRALRAGAQVVLESTLGNANSAPAQGAALHAASMSSHPIHVIMPYSDRLESFAAWFQQLWAESLGKEGKGSTAVRALGSVDQHSQLQLYLDGPQDKTFSLFLPEDENGRLRISSHGVDSIAYLDGQSMGAVMQSMQHGTLETLKAHHCPVRVFRLPKIDAFTLGALIMHSELETILTASLIGINAFDQPAVEHSKQLAREYLNRQQLPGAKANTA